MKHNCKRGKSVTNIKDLQIYIVDIDPMMCQAMQNKFRNVSTVQVVQSDIKAFFEKNRNAIDCLVSPANAYGYMSGGYDARLSDILGWDFQEKVQNYIKDNCFGEQGVGTSFIIKTNLSNLYLIHTPTMQRPNIIKDDMIVYYCMRSTLMCAMQNNIKSIVIPVFGGSCGGLTPEIASTRMFDAYRQIANYNC